MTASGPHQARPGRRGVLPWGGVLRQSWVDAGPLAVGMVVVAAAAFLSSVVPQAMDAVATAELRTALSDERVPVTVVVTVPMTGVGYQLAPDTAGSAARVADQVEAGMPAELRAVLAEPVTTLAGPELKAGVIGGRPGRVRFVYLAGAGGPGVEWVEGRPPVATGDPTDVGHDDGRALPVEVAVSQAGADLMGVHPDTRIAVDSPDGQPLEVWVSGIYRATDPRDDAWEVAPTLLEPQLVDGSAAVASVGLLLTPDSLPFARLAVYPPGMTRSYTYPVVPSALDAAGAALVATQARGLASGRKAFDIPGTEATVTTRLDRVLDASLARIDAATAQASVLLIGVLATALLVELLAAGLVVARRARVLGQWRSRGATLPVVGLASAAESAGLAAVAGLVGVVAAGLVAGGSTPWAWTLPAIVAGAIPQPVLAILAARRATAGRRPPSGRRSGLTAPQVRRLAAEATVVLLALGALGTLAVRGVPASAGSVAADVVVLAAPVLVALAVSLGLVRAQPVVLRAARRAAARARDAVPLLAAARARAGGLATATLVTAAAIAAIAASVAGTASQGRADAAWEAVGADAAATTTTPAGLPPAVAALDGVDGLAVATAATIPAGQLIGTRLDQAVAVVAVDADAMARLLAATPAGEAPGLAALAARPGGVDDPVPVLVSGGPGWEGATLRWGDDSVAVRPVGDAAPLPAWLTGEGDVVVVDREVLAQAAGHEIVATRAWAVGPGAEAGLAATLAADADATVVSRAGWLATQASAPVTLALGWLFPGASAVATGLAALAVGLMAASGAGERTRAAAQTKVLGLPRAAAARVAWLEATVPAVVASAAGIATGIGIAGLLVAALDLPSVTGGRQLPGLVVPWWAFALPVALGLVARLAVAVAAPSHHEERLGPLIRAG